MCGRTANNRNKAGPGDPRRLDPCLAPFIRLLNRKGIQTVFSCCGHGAERPTVTLGGPAMARMLHSDARQWVRNARRPGMSDDWLVELDAVVCTPPRIVPYLNMTRAQIRDQRKRFGFSRP